MSSRKGIEILVGQAVLKFWIKTVKTEGLLCKNSGFIHNAYSQATLLNSQP